MSTGNIRAVVILADDIRQEVGGKVSIMGAYDTDIEIVGNVDWIPVASFIKVIGPPDTDIKKIVVDYRIDGVAFYRQESAAEFLESGLERHRTHMQELRGLPGGRTVDDALLVQLSFKIMIPSPPNSHLLSIYVDLGDGFVGAGSYPIRRIKPENAQDSELPSE